MLKIESDDEPVDLGVPYLKTDPFLAGGTGFIFPHDPLVD